MSALTQSSAWQALQAHARELSGTHLNQLFSGEPDRFGRFQLEAAGVLLDYSKQRLTARSQDLLLDLARSCSVQAGIAAMFAGETINFTENRAALHTALRNVDAQGSPVRPMPTNGRDVMPEV